MSHSGSEATDPTQAEITGSCLCGGVRYRARGPFELVARCHCRECRKASGAEFATNGTVASVDFELLEGDSLVREYESSPGQRRVFCGRCGSPLFKRNDDRPDRIRLRFGCLDTPVDAHPALQAFISERLAITPIAEDVPAFETLPGA